jgi:hypothetical protein
MRTAEDVTRIPVTAQIMITLGGIMERHVIGSILVAKIAWHSDADAASENEDDVSSWRRDHAWKEIRERAPQTGGRVPALKRGCSGQEEASSRDGAVM